MLRTLLADGGSSSSPSIDPATLLGSHDTGQSGSRITTVSHLSDRGLARTHVSLTDGVLARRKKEWTMSALLRDSLPMGQGNGVL